MWILSVTRITAYVTVFGSIVRYDSNRFPSKCSVSISNALSDGLCGEFITSLKSGTTGVPTYNLRCQWFLKLYSFLESHQQYVFTVGNVIRCMISELIAFCWRGFSNRNGTDFHWCRMWVICNVSGPRCLCSYTHSGSLVCNFNHLWILHCFEKFLVAFLAWHLLNVSFNSLCIAMQMLCFADFSNVQLDTLHSVVEYRQVFILAPVYKFLSSNYFVIESIETWNERIALGLQVCTCPPFSDFLNTSRHFCGAAVKQFTANCRESVSLSFSE